MIPDRVLRLPDAGKLLICTDLHGNLRDFEAMVSRFDELRAGGEPAFLLFTGDLIHGPNTESEADWPSYLGSYYRDRSGDVVERFIELREAHAGQVACLIGNHEHSHVGGPHTPKFWDDETAYFEQSVGPERAARYNAVFAGLPLIAISQAGVAVTHAAPNAQIDDISQLQVAYDGYEHIDINSMYNGTALARLLWSRGCPVEIARDFLDVISRGGPRQNVVVFGHDIVAEGFDRVGDEQLQLSTSFGVEDACKYYVEVDLAERYERSADFEVGRELRRLYPDARRLENG